MITDLGLNIEVSDVEPKCVWEAANLAGVDGILSSRFVEKITSFILSKLVPVGISATVDVDEIRFSISVSKGSENIQSVILVVGSLFRFLSVFVPANIARRLWISFSRNLLKLRLVSQDLVDLESSLISNHYVPVDTPQALRKEWESSQESVQRSRVNQVLADVRSGLLADVNRKTVQLNINSGKQFKSAYVPRIVSHEAMLLVEKHFKSGNPFLISQVLSLFTILRQPEFSDPNAVSPRNSAIFFNDCVYLTIALSLIKDMDLSPDIVLLRAAASRSVSFFTTAVANRSCQHLKDVSDKAWALGLGNNQQMSLGEKACSNALSEIAVCLKEWKALDIDTDVQGIWSAMMVDPVLKEFTRQSVTCAKGAIGNARGRLMGSSPSAGSINSGIWSVFRKFTSEIENLVGSETLSVLNSWRAAVLIRMSLCGNTNDIYSSQSITQDEELYGVSKAGVESLLMCNPLLQGETKDRIKQLASKLVVSPNDVEIDSPTKREVKERDYGALFSRG